MSSSIVKAHGGSRDIIGQKGEGIVLGGILKNTMMNVPMDAKEKHLDRLITQTTGMPAMKPVMEGVIDSTIPKHMKDVPEIHKVSAHDIGKTKTKRMGQVPYAGKMY